MSNYLAWIDQKGWEHKPLNSSNEVQIKNCPFCQDSNYHFYVNARTGLFHCKQPGCQSAGNWYKLLKHTGDLKETSFQANSRIEIEETKIGLYHKSLLNSNDVLQYLHRRKISDDAIRYFMLGFTQKNGQDVLVIPYFENGKLINLRYRSLDKKSYWWEPKGKIVLFNGDILYNNLDQIVITEGELDAMAVWSSGIHKVVSVPSGAGSFKPEWVDKLSNAAKMFICFDNDRAGWEGASALAERFDYEKGRLFYVQLPPRVKDVNQFFGNGASSAEFIALLKRSRPFEVRNVVSFEGAMFDWKERLLYGTNGAGVKTQWSTFNEKIKDGFRGGDLLIWSGFPGVGKTTFLLNWAWWLAYSQHIPVLFYCLEMSDERLLPRLGAHVLQKEELTNGDIDKLMEYNDVPLYFVRDYDFRKRGNYFLELIRTVAKRYGVKMVFFDNLQFAINDATNVTAQTTALSKNFKLLAEDLKMPISVVHHLTKVEEENRPPTSGALRDSGMVRGNADYIFILHRKRIEKEENIREDVFEKRGVLVIDKARYSSAGLVRMEYDGGLATWKEENSQYQFLVA